MILSSPAPPFGPCCMECLASITSGSGDCRCPGSSPSPCGGRACGSWRKRIEGVASESPGRERELARALAWGVQESDFMPDVSDLAEFMPEQVFIQRHGGVDGAGYRKMMAKIDACVDARPLLRR
jgi:hypothetical protein